MLSQVYFGLHEIGQLELQGAARGLPRLRMWMWPNGHAQTCASRVWHIAYCMACTECGISRIRHVALACAGSSAQLRSLFLSRLSLPVTLASPLWQLSALVASLLAHLTLTLAHQNPFGNLQPGLPSCLWLPAPAPVPAYCPASPLPAVWLRLAQSTRSICIFYCVLIN